MNKSVGAAGVCILALVFIVTPTVAQQEAVIRIDASGPRERLAPVWAFFGYDEPNYTYAPNGEKLLAELSELSTTAVQIRMHNLLTSGDGTAALKWGSTNVYSKDATGRSIYDWTILDRILDTLRRVKAKPLVEIGFMPQALSVRPQPYRHHWPQGTLWTGWAHRGRASIIWRAPLPNEWDMQMNSWDSGRRRYASLDTASAFSSTSLHIWLPRCLIFSKRIW